MSVQSKALVSIIAVAAFIVGIVVNSDKVEEILDASPVVTAELETADGLASVEQNLKRLNLVNFWATWCAPCRHEMPIFEAMYKLHGKDGFQVIGIAIDNIERSQPFLDSMGISYPILYAEKTGMQILEATGNPEGLLPYSLLLDENGNVLDQVLGKIDEEMIRVWLEKYSP